MEYLKRYNSLRLEMNLDIDKGLLTIDELIDKYSFSYIRKFLTELMEIVELETPECFNKPELTAMRQSRYCALIDNYPKEDYPELWL